MTKPKSKQTAKAQPEKPPEPKFKSRPINRDMLNRAISETIVLATQPKIDSALKIVQSIFDRCYFNSVKPEVMGAVTTIIAEYGDSSALLAHRVFRISGKEFCTPRAYWVPERMRYNNECNAILNVPTAEYAELCRAVDAFSALTAEKNRLIEAAKIQLSGVRTTAQLEQLWPEVHAAYQKINPDLRVDSTSAIIVRPKAREELEKYPNGKEPQVRIGQTLRDAKKTQTPEEPK